MADITFTDFLAVNPGLEDVLDPNGTLGSSNSATQLDIINTGPDWTGFVFRLTGTDFTYAPDGTPVSGIISGVTIFDDAENVVASAVGGTGGLGDTSLGGFWANLQLGQTLGAVASVLGAPGDLIEGGSGENHLVAYGPQSTVIGGDAADFLWSRYNSAATLVGNGGDDTIHIDNPSNAEIHYTVAGSGADGSGGSGETNTLEISGQNIHFASITDIDRLNFADSTSPSNQSVFLDASQIGAGYISPSLAIGGNAAAGYGDIIYITAGTALDLSGWTFSNWTFNGWSQPGSNVTIFAGSDNDSIVGSAAADFFNASNGNGHTLWGGGGDDEFYLLNSTGGHIFGGGGIDWLNLARQVSTDSLNIDLTDPTHTTTLADGTTFVDVERMDFHAGYGNDTLTGGAYDDGLFGGDGNDSLSGGGGNDYLEGGSSGQDTLLGGDGDDYINASIGDVIDGGAGNDDLIIDLSSVSQSVSASAATGIGKLADDTILFQSIELFTLTTGSGNDTVVFNNNLTSAQQSGYGNQSFDGKGGTDTASLDFSQLAEAVFSHFADADNDFVTDTSGHHTVSLVHVENLDFLGGSGNDTIDGHSGVNSLAGGAGNDELTGAAHNDTLRGGLGADQLFGKDGADVFVYGANEAVSGEVVDGGTGTDTVQALADVDFSGVSFTGIETLSFFGAHTLTFDQHFVGNPFALVIGDGNTNTIDIHITASGFTDLSGVTFQSWTSGVDAVTITGSAVSDNVSGTSEGDSVSGGAGIDILAGNGGADTIHGGTSADLIDGGDGDDRLYGDDGADNIDGGDGADSLDGGAGVDILSGGDGSDIYVVDNKHDVTDEAVNQGIDTVQASLTWSLDDNIENLTLTGSSAINGTGNELANLIVGNTGANSLDGGAGKDTLAGGLGADALKGGSGADTFRFNTALGTANIDKISDFSHTDDTIEIDNAVMAALTKPMSSSQFLAAKSGHAATSTSQHIIYDKSNGTLWYDADGKGHTAAIEFAVLTTKPTNIDWHDFTIV